MVVCPDLKSSEILSKAQGKGSQETGPLWFDVVFLVANGNKLVLAIYKYRRA